MSNDDAETHELLAGGYLSGAQYDAIETRVLDAVAPVRRPRRWPWLAAAAAFASGVCLWLTTSAELLEFRPKGTPGAPGVLGVTCGAADARTCRVGSTLMFTVNAALVSGYLGAYARSCVDSGEGERIWYFPDAAGTMPEVRRADGTVVLERGIHVGPEHGAGCHHVTVWVSEVPVARPLAGDAPPENSLAVSEFEIYVVP